MMNNENGRSMVEMLGVLAIIGVLSVAGIAGYSMAMKKYRANEITNVASQAVVLAQTFDAGEGLTSGSKTLKQLGYTAVIPEYMGTSATISVTYQSTTPHYKVSFTNSEACTTAANAVGDSGVFTISC